MQSRKSILEQIIKQMGSLHRYMATSRDGFLSRYGLNRPQIELLFSLKYGSSSTKELATRFGISSSAISQMVDQLEQHRLVERRTDPHDRRITLVCLSTSGKKTFAEFRKHFLKHLEAKFDVVSTKELETLLSVIERINSDVEKENT